MANKTSKATEPTPTTEPVGDAATALGFRADTKTHTAALMYLRQDGATMAEIKGACGGPQRNLLKTMETKGHTVEKFTVEQDGKTRTSYKIVPKA